LQWEWGWCQAMERNHVIMKNKCGCKMGLSQWCYWSFKSSGMWRWAIGCVVPDISHGSCLHLVCEAVHDYPEDEGTVILWNLWKFTPNNTVHLRWLESSKLCLHVFSSRCLHKHLAPLPLDQSTLYLHSVPAHIHLKYSDCSVSQIQPDSTKKSKVMNICTYIYSVFFW
jgi:hypothetical protein